MVLARVAVLVGMLVRHIEKVHTSEDNIVWYRCKKLLGAPGIATRSKDATRGSWPYY